MASYTHEVVKGVHVLVWQYMPSNAPNIEALKMERKQQKDIAGSQNINVPMLDKRLRTTGLEYCDIIIYCDNIATWKMAIWQYYAAVCTIVPHPISHGVQLELKIGEMVFVTVNFYNNAKIMVQAGNCVESNLLEFLAAIPAILQLRASIAASAGPQ